MNRLNLTIATAALGLLFFAPAAPAKEAVDFFGGVGTLGGQFDSNFGPQGVAVNDTGAGLASAGDLYVLDDPASNRIQRFGRDDAGTPADHSDDTYFFISAWGADVVQPGGTGDVGDAAAADYEVCTNPFQCKAGVPSGGNGTPAGNGALDSPGGIAVDQDTGNVYVSDGDSNRINVYDGTGNFLFSVGRDVAEPDGGAAVEVCDGGTDTCRAGDTGSGPGEIAVGSSGIAVSPADGDPATGTLFLADSGNQRVNTYSLEGSNPASIGSAAFSNQFPTTVAVDSRGILYADSGTAGGVEVERYDTEGANGTGVGLLAPIPPAVTETQQLTVAATGGTYRLSFDPDDAGPRPPETTIDIPFNWPDGGGIFIGNEPPLDTVTEALAALPSISHGRTPDGSVIDVRGGPGDAGGSQPYVVRFGGFNYGPLYGQDVPQLTCINGAVGAVPLSGGAGCSVATTTPGQPGALRPAALAIDPDTDALYVATSTGIVQQFGPANAPGLTAPPTEEDNRHGTGPAFSALGALATEPSSGRLYAAARAGVAGPGVYVLDDVNPASPVASLDFCDEIAATSFTCHATIDPNGLPATSYRFQFVEDASYQANGFANAQTTATVLLGGQNDPQVVEGRIEPPGLGLKPNTTYHVRLSYQRRFAAEQFTPPLTPTTLAAPPAVETAGSPLRTASTATLLGRVLPNGSATAYRFQYGTQGPCEVNPCAETPPIASGEGHETRLASQNVEGLEANTTYYYRIVASNGVGGDIFGQNRALTTRASGSSLPRNEFPGPPGSDRAYELVSISDSNGNPLGFVGPQAYASDGNRVAYTIFGGTPISDSGSAFSMYFAERPPGVHPTVGWQTRPVTPPRGQLFSPNWKAPLYGPADISRLVAFNTLGSVGSLSGALWSLPTDGGAPTQLFETVAPAEIAALGISATYDSFFGVSADADRVVAALNFGSLDPAFPAAAGVSNLYDVSAGGAPQLVSLMPDGEPPACGLAKGELAGPQKLVGAQSAGWVSADGSRLYFHTNGDNCAAQPQLYMRDLDAAKTELLSGPVISGPGCAASLIRSSAEAAFFATKSRLDPADAEPSNCENNAPDNDIYRYNLEDKSLVCLTCMVPGRPAKVDGNHLNDIAIAPDGSRIYFSSRAQLLPGAPPAGQNAIYRLNVASGDLAYLAPGSSIGPNQSTVDISFDGRFLAFRSSAAALDPLGGAFQNGGEAQYYLYDDEARSIVCASCPPDGSPATDHAAAQLTNAEPGTPGNSALSDDGTLAFVTTVPLLAADQNTPSAGGDPLVGNDVYEFRDGRPLLITDGLTSWPPSETTAPLTMAVSPSGRDVFFSASASLTPNALDGVRRLYTARIGGGIDFPEPREPCPLEVCQGTPQGAPAEPPPGSSNFHGPGNPPQESLKKCQGSNLRRHGKCVKKHRKHKHQKHRKRHHRAPRHTQGAG